MCKKYFFLPFILFLGLSNLAFSQFWFLGQRGREKYVNVKFAPQSTLAIGAGTSTYMGELLPSQALLTTGMQSTRMNIGVQYTKHFHPRFSYKGSLSYLQIAGDDNYYGYGVGDEGKRFASNFERNLHFKNQLVELAAFGMFDFVKRNPFRKKRADFSPYVMVGIAAVYSDPKARGVPEILSNSLGQITGFRQAGWVSLNGVTDENSAANTEIVGTEGSKYSPIQMALPMGFGFRWKLTDAIDIGAEFNYRLTFTDLLDDVSDNRINKLDVNTTYSNRSINKDFSNGLLPSPGKNEIYAANTWKLLPAPGTFLPQTPIVGSRGNDSYFTTQVMLIFHLGRPMGSIN